MTMFSIYNDTHILLGEIIKEGKLKGMFNGFGGKVEAGESIQKAAERELQEEAGITPLDTKRRGIISFEFEEGGNPFEGAPDVEMHVFSATKFEGQPSQSREMNPTWFLHGDVPYDNMWPDDRYWLPLIFQGKNFTGKFLLKDPKTIISHNLKEVESL